MMTGGGAGWVGRRGLLPAQGDGQQPLQGGLVQPVEGVLSHTAALHQAPFPKQLHVVGKGGLAYRQGRQQLGGALFSLLGKLSEDAQPVGVRQQTEPRCRLGIIHGNPPLIHDYQYIIQLMRLWHQDTKYIDICQ